MVDSERTLQDFGLLVDCAVFSPEWVVDFQRNLQARLERRLPGTEYLSRVVDSYAHKIEVYDPAHGSFPLNSGQMGGEKYGGARYHHVSVDLQLHVEEVEDEHDDQNKGVPGGRPRRGGDRAQRRRAGSRARVPARGLSADARLAGADAARLREHELRRGDR